MLLHLLPVRILVRSLSLTPHPRLDHQLLVCSAPKFLIIEKSPKSQRLIFCNHASEFSQLVILFLSKYSTWHV